MEQSSWLSIAAATVCKMQMRPIGTRYCCMGTEDPQFRDPHQNWRITVAPVAGCFSDHPVTGLH